MAPAVALALACSLACSCSCAPLPPNVDAFSWASATAVQLALDGMPMNARDGSFPKMLEAVSSAILTHSERIPRTTSFVEVFSGAAGTARALSSIGRASYTFDRCDF